MKLLAMVGVVLIAAASTPVMASPTCVAKDPDTGSDCVNITGSSRSGPNTYHYMFTNSCEKSFTITYRKDDGTEKEYWVGAKEHGYLLRTQDFICVNGNAGIADCSTVEFSTGCD